MLIIHSFLEAWLPCLANIKSKLNAAVGFREQQLQDPPKKYPAYGVMKYDANLDETRR
jgi:hypothetical protein